MLFIFSISATDILKSTFYLIFFPDCNTVDFFANYYHLALVSVVPFSWLIQIQVQLAFIPIFYAGEM